MTSNIQIISILTCNTCQYQAVNKEETLDSFEAYKNGSREKPKFVHKGHECQKCKRLNRIKDDQGASDSLVNDIHGNLW